MRRNSTYERVMLSVLIVLGVALLGLLIRGFAIGSFEVSAEIIVEADEELVWPYIDLPELRTDWQPGIIDIVSAEGPEVAHPARLILIYLIEGQTHEVPEIITVREPRSFWQSDRDAEIYQERVVYRVIPLQEGWSKVEMTKTRSYQSYRDRVLAPFSGFFESDRIDLSLERLAFLLSQSVAQSRDN